MATVGYAADKKNTAEKKTENENVVEVTPSKGTTPEELAAIIEYFFSKYKFL